jgi:ribonuclease P protein component
MRLETLKRSADFKRVRGGARQHTASFLIEGKKRPGDSSSPAGKAKSEAGTGARSEPPSQQARFGFTITKKIGGAVIRNRIRRRLKAALRALDADAARPDFDYVIVARDKAYDQPFGELAADLAKALQRIGAGDRHAGADRARPIERPGAAEQRSTRPAATGATPRKERAAPIHGPGDATEKP